MSDPQTHHPTCYREHHACAVARLDRLHAAMATEPRIVERLLSAEKMEPEYIGGGDYQIPSEVTNALNDAYDVLVAVRDITEGR